MGKKDKNTEFSLNRVFYKIENTTNGYYSVYVYVYVHTLMCDYVILERLKFWYKSFCSEF